MTVDRARLFPEGRHRMTFEDIIHFPSRHEALGVWAGAAASVAVGIVAVVVAFLQDSFVRRGERRKIGVRSLSAATAALEALQVIDALTKDLFEKQRTSGASGAVGFQPDWRFELNAVRAALRVCISPDLPDPALLQHLVRVDAWSEQASAALGAHPTHTGDGAREALRSLQGGNGSRAEVAASLQGMMRQFLAMAAHGNRIRAQPRSQPEPRNR